MATQDALDLNTRQMHAAPYGDVVMHEGNVIPAQALNGDIWRVVRIPAGTRVETVTIINDQVDSSTGLTAKIGYTPVNSNDGPAANDAYWFVSASFARAAAAAIMVAQPIQFEFDVWLIITVTANATTYVPAKKVTAIVEGRSIGTK